MDEKTPLDLHPGTPRDPRLTPLGLARVIRRWRRPVLAVVLGIPLLTAAVLLFVPNKYRARGTILVETPEGAAGMEMLGQLSAFTGLPQGIPSADIYLSILRSERVAIAVADSLDLPARYRAPGGSDEERMERTLRMMKKRVKVDQPDFVTLHISATDKDRRLAADIVNAFMTELEKTNRNLSFTRAFRTRQLVEDALAETQEELRASWLELKEFQETYGLISLEQQVEATMTLIGELQGQLLEAKAQREALLAYRAQNSGQLRNLDLTIAALQNQIDQLMGQVPEGTDALDSAGVAADYLLELDDVPRLSAEYARLMMDLKVQEAKYNVLATKLEQTKIEESQSLPAFEVLDRARVPQRKTSPNRRMFVLFALLAGLACGVMLALLLDDLDHRLDEEAREELAAWLPGFLRRRLPAGGSSSGGGRTAAGL